MRPGISDEGDMADFLFGPAIVTSQTRFEMWSYYANQYAGTGDPYYLQAMQSYVQADEGRYDRKGRFWRWLLTFARAHSA